MQKEISCSATDIDPMYKSGTSAEVDLRDRAKGKIDPQGGDVLASETLWRSNVSRSACANEVKHPDSIFCGELLYRGTVKQ